MLQCNIENHRLAEINGVCFKEDCLNRRPSCFFCLQTLHQNHQQIVKDFQNFNEKQTLALETQNQLVACIGELETLVAQLKDINSRINIDFQFDIQQATIQSLHIQTNEIIKLLLLNPPITELKNFQQCYKQSSDTGFKQFKEVNSQLINIQLTEYKFCTNLSHPTTTLSNYIATNHNEEMKAFFNVCMPTISSTRRQHFKFKILECCWIFLGVCQKNKIIEANYIPVLSNLGHGYIYLNNSSYVINNYGQAYSSDQFNPQNQIQNQRFSFEKNNIINVSIDFDLQTINWINESKNLSFTIRIKTDQELSPCVGLWKSSVEIINVQIQH